jgi:hypothetical protein
MSQERRSLTRAELFGGLISAVVVLGLITVTSLGRENEFVRTFLLGPKGLFLGGWLVLWFGILVFLMRRHSK